MVQKKIVHFGGSAKMFLMCLHKILETENAMFSVTRWWTQSLSKSQTFIKKYDLILKDLDLFNRYKTSLWYDCILHFSVFHQKHWLVLIPLTHQNTNAIVNILIEKLTFDKVTSLYFQFEIIKIRTFFSIILLGLAFYNLD